MKECISVHITFLFFYFNNTLRCYNKIKKEKYSKHITLMHSFLEKYTKGCFKTKKNIYFKTHSYTYEDIR